MNSKMWSGRQQDQRNNPVSLVEANATTVWQGNDEQWIDENRFLDEMKYEGSSFDHAVVYKTKATQSFNHRPLLTPVPDYRNRALHICASVLIGLMNVQQKNSHKNHRPRRRGKNVLAEHNFRFYCTFFSLSILREWLAPFALQTERERSTPPVDKRKKKCQVQQWPPNNST